MRKSVLKLLLVLGMAFTANAFVTLAVSTRVMAAPPAKKAKWQTPTKTSTGNKSVKNTKQSKQKKSVTKAKQNSLKKQAKPTKKATLNKNGNKAVLNTSIKKDTSKKKVVAEKKVVVENKPEENTLIVDENLTDLEFENAEERSTSPLLVVFVTFVICCFGGMVFLNSRKKQLEAAKLNFQEASNHEVAFSSSQQRLDSSHPTHSGHETPTTRTLFERTDKADRSSSASQAKTPGFFGKISSKAASLIKHGKDKNPPSAKVKEMPIQFDSEDLNSGSITSIGAVKSIGVKHASNPPVGFNPESTIEPMPANSGSEPCSFENYIEIQIAAQCWRAQKLSLDTKLRETFNIDTSMLIQYEFYWKQKISNNVNLKKKYQELEPLYTAKYEAA